MCVPFVGRALFLYMIGKVGVYSPTAIPTSIYAINLYPMIEEGKVISPPHSREGVLTKFWLCY